jgi:NAD(P)-dependent dehydrogenase (short-subunit alcohol dehydrogenase family)
VTARRPLKLQGKTILVTGSTDGLGRLVARRLADAGAHVLLHGRNRERGQALLKEIGGSAAGHAFYEADLASLAEVRKLAASVLKDHDRIDMLVNNAGIGTASPDGQRQLSADGHELRLAVNYLSGFLLTHLLLPTLKKSAPARIVNVASIGQQALDFDDVMLERGYDGPRAYRQSKLAQIMFTIDLARELKGKGVTANCLHPATFMDTTMVRQSGTKPISTIAEGADAVLNLVTADAVSDMSGLFFNGLKEQRANEQAYDDAARAQLRALSLKLTGLA